MKYTWEEGDIYAGRVVENETGTERYMIGWRQFGGQTRYKLVALGNGEVHGGQINTERFTERLNEMSLVPIARSDVFIDEPL